MEITGTVNKIEVPIIIDGEEISIIRLNPHSPLIMRNAANVIKLLNEGILNADEFDIPESDIETLKSEDVTIKNITDGRKFASVVKYANFIDNIIMVCDKFFCASITEKLLGYDDDELNLLKQTFEVVFGEITKARKSITDKYQA